MVAHSLLCPVNDAYSAPAQEVTPSSALMSGVPNRNATITNSSLENVVNTLVRIVSMRYFDFSLAIPYFALVTLLLNNGKGLILVFGFVLLRNEYIFMYLSRFTRHP